MSLSVSLRQLDNLKDGNNDGTGYGVVLVTQDRMIDSYTAKVDVKAKADATKKSDDSDASKINTPKINVKRGIGKPFAVAIALY